MTATPDRPYEEVNAQPDYAAVERDVLEFWKRERVFDETVHRDGPDYVFYEGPPTANGRPAMHHVLARAFKDLYPRYKTMKGYHVTRKGGWDTHGLPVEISVEKKLGMLGRAHDRTREELETFNRLCRESVFENIQDWNTFTERLGYWVDLEHAYVTYHNEYIESVWNLLKRLFDRGLIEQDYKVVPLSPRISTTLSAAEISDGYRDVEDPSVYVKLPLKPRSTPPAWRDALTAQHVDPARLDGASLLVWTTTPWTLPTNTAAAVNPNLEYALVDSDAGALIVAVDALERLREQHGDALPVIARFPGRVMERAKYTPPFPEVFEELGVTTAAHYVVLADFVTAEDGSGLAHESPAYGAEDLEVCRAYGLPVVFGVDDHGILRVTSERGKFFKDADPGLMRLMRERGVLYHAGRVLHSYPFHDRTGDPILYFAKPSWFVRTSRYRAELVAQNNHINWVPDHIKQGRFGNWLENNVDWAISRERYWGTPLPLWRADDGDTICVGSVAELSRLTGRDLDNLDLHRPYIDDISFERNGKTYRRVPEVLDVWFDSGAMPYAQWHLLVDDGVAVQGGADFQQHYPADFICEAIDQTRGWFYSLHAISVLLYDRPAYQNVVCLGHIVDEHGQKMSKSKGNVVEPLPVFDRYGADSVRWYMYTVSEPGDSKRFSERLVAEAQRGFVNTLWNVYAFYVLYANLDRPDLNSAPSVDARPEIDRWLLARLEVTKRAANDALDAYDARRAARAIESFVDELSNWYVRRNRRRFWKSAVDADTLAAYATLHEALVTTARLAAPFTPFLAEALYRNLEAGRPGAPRSVHLCPYPEPDAARADDALVRDMAVVQRVVDYGRAARGQAGLKTRQPLPAVLVRARDDTERSALERFRAQIEEELNVKRVELLDEGADLVQYALKPNLPTLGRKHGRMIPAIREALNAADPADIARHVREGRDVPLDTSAGRVTLAPEDVLVDARSAEGYAAYEGDGFLVALDARLTPELIREGLARDLVRAVQQARKDAGFAVSDEIELRLELSGDALDAAREHAASLGAETLAREVSFEAPRDGDVVVELEDGGRLGVRRA